MNEPIRKSILPTTPPPEWEFATVLGAPHGCALLPTDTGDVVVRRRVTYGDWEPVRPDHWADEPATVQGAARTASGQQPETDVVAYRSRYAPHLLFCREHKQDWPGFTPLTTDDLPDGGICTWGPNNGPKCGRDVLIPTSGQQPETEPLRPRAERCPEPECTDKQQCWRCDYEESQHAARRPAATPTCTSTHPARPTRCILPGRHAVPHTDGAGQWPEHVPAVGQPAEAQATDEARPPRVQWGVEYLRTSAPEPWWDYDQRTWDTREKAQAEIDRYAGSSVRRRLVRETTTWTVEDEEARS